MIDAIDVKNLGKWAIGLPLLEQLVIRHPERVLELGSGKGTKELRKVTTVYSIESNENYILEAEGEHKSFLVPIDQKTKWYDRDKLTSALAGLEYDLVLVDGPSRRGREGFLDNIDLFDKTKVFIIDDTQRASILAMISPLRKIFERRPIEFKGGKKNKFVIFEKKKIL